SAADVRAAVLVVDLKAGPVEAVAHLQERTVLAEWPVVVDEVGAAAEDEVGDEQGGAARARIDEVVRIEEGALLRESGGGGEGENCGAEREAHHGTWIARR